MVSSLTFLRNRVKLCITWDRNPVYATIQEDDGHSYFTQQRRMKGNGQDGSRVTNTQELTSKDSDGPERTNTKR